MKKKTSGFLVNMVVLFTLIQTAIQIQVHAEGGPSLVSGIGLTGKEAIKSPFPETSITGTVQIPQSYIYFGKDDSVNGIKWRVLSTNRDNAGHTGAIFLLSEDLLEKESVKFQSVKLYRNRNNWAISDSKQWCTTFIGNTDHFNPIESNAVRGITKTDKTGEYYGYMYDASILNNEKLFFLSAQELNDYIGSYDYAPGLITYHNGIAARWWLRSPVDDRNAGVVNNYGSVIFHSVLRSFACRAALNINHESVIFTSAAVGGKLSNIEGITGLQNVENTETKDWKLTLIDNDRAFALNRSTEVIDNNQIRINYIGATSAENEYISAIIKDKSSNIIYYGRIKQVANGQESGEFLIELPVDFDKDRHTINILNEQCNGDKLTDYASKPIEINLNGI